jgi:hypothetical protein
MAPLEGWIHAAKAKHLRACARAIETLRGRPVARDLRPLVVPTVANQISLNGKPRG